MPWGTSLLKVSSSLPLSFLLPAAVFRGVSTKTQFLAALHKIPPGFTIFHALQEGVQGFSFLISCFSYILLRCLEWNRNIALNNNVICLE